MKRHRLSRKSETRLKQASEMPREERLKKAVAIFNTPEGTVQQKIFFLKEHVGMSDIEITEAMNIASGGMVLKTALGKHKVKE